ncbi:thiol reductant ABC exporter subunit CydC [Swingsia samuiensis]|uniref:Thiol reductant ABC exporter subunit CydC n=1 Tax=Swingsia samuiensis TaxID=1293412 RepID=A0A4Y6UJV3_9PROT|nr:thiol reductant ABC exporter subunit CydC [Swingsia samuiensis]QDH17899.1 thiol reductant ABC exporter subunit CydC [Swingsia samuiensis]
MSNSNTPSHKSPLSQVLSVWRPHYKRLALGILLAESTVCASLALMGQTGSRITHAAIGVAAGSILLQIIGSSQIILRYSERLYTHDAMFRAISDLRVWFYRRLAYGAAAGLGFQRTGDLLSRIVSDVQQLDNLYLRIIIPLTTAFITLPVVFLVWIKEGGITSAILTLIFLVLIFIIPFIGAKISLRYQSDILDAESELRIAALDFASGLREVRAFSAEKVLSNIIIDKQEKLFSVQARQALQMALAHGVAQLFAKIGILVALCAVVGILLPKTETIWGISTLFLTIAAMDGVTGLARAGLLYGETSYAAKRIIDINNQATLTPEGNATLPQSSDIRLEHVNFRWDPNRPLIFNDLSLTLRQGERVALIGPSGAGKSSLAALLLKVVVPEKGEIFLGETNINSLNNEKLRSRIAWLSQASHLFDDTIRSNLLLGRTDLSDAELWTALEQAQIADMVRDLPDGLDTWIGEHGSKLSGGQGRRIALARVLLSNAPILILDEPTTGLDADTERDFIATLNTISAGKSILLISHRLIGIEKLDRIWQLENGRIVSSAG